jgi:hypothetical protein
MLPHAPLTSHRYHAVGTVVQKVIHQNGRFFDRQRLRQIVMLAQSKCDKGKKDSVFHLPNN